MKLIIDGYNKTLRKKDNQIVVMEKDNEIYRISANKVSDITRIFFEVFPEESGKRIILYLKKINNKYFECNKVLAPYILEQIFDENNQIVSESIKENH